MRVVVHTFVEFDLTDTVSPRLVDNPAHFNNALFVADFFEADNVTEHALDVPDAPDMTADVAVGIVVVVTEVRLNVPTDENT